MRRLITLLAASAAATAVVAAQPAAAAHPQASGTAHVTSLAFNDVRSAGGNTILEGVQQGDISGTFTGTFVEQFRLVVHADGTTNFHSFLTVVGTAGGCGAGTIRFVVDGQGEGPVTEGRVRTIDQNDTTVNVHAVLEAVVFVPTGTITYTGTYTCG